MLDRRRTPFPIRPARRANAVPPGRLGYDLGAPALLLHTVQSAGAFEELLATGRIVPDAGRAHADYAEPDAWMLCQMEQRLPTRGDGALWLWAKTRRADLIHQCRWLAGGVLLTCRIPRERVLLSHYAAWHDVLNSTPGYWDLPGETEEEADARIDALLDDFHARLTASGASTQRVSGWPTALREEIEATWEGIFDQSRYSRTAHWQATVHEIRIGDVVEAVRFEDRRFPDVR